MHKEWIISVILIGCILIGNTWMENKTKQAIEEMENKLNLLKSSMLETVDAEKEREKREPEEQIRQQMKEVKEYWDTQYNSLAFFIEHTELEKVKTQLFQLDGNIMVQDYEQAIPSLETCRWALEYIKEKNQFALRNIF